MGTIKRDSSNDLLANTTDGEDSALSILAEKIASSDPEWGIHEHILLGDVHATRTPVRLTTILGSCVAICLYDTHNKIGGMNHFVLPGAPQEHEVDPLRWADASIEELFRKVMALGASREHLKAKVFGGAQLADRPGLAQFKIGEGNVKQALDELARRKVEVTNSCVGGSIGRKIVFEPHTGNVWVKEFHRIIH